MDPVCRARLTPLLADVVTRRGSLRLLAALLLIKASTEAAAADPPVRRVQDRAAQRRQLRRHRRKHNRTDRRQEANKNQDKDKDKDNVQGLFRNTALTVQNVGSQLLATDSVTFFFRTKTGLDTYGNWIPASTVDLAPNQSYRFAQEHFRVGALISFPPSLEVPQAFVDVRNLAFGFPQGAIYNGHGLDPPSGKLGSVLLRDGEHDFLDAPDDDRPDEKQVYYRVFHDGLGRDYEVDLTLGRRHDSEGFIEFHLDVLIFKLGS